MADFVQTMKDWRRMCKANSTDDDNCCKGCPVVDFRENGCCAIYEVEDSIDWQRYADAIMAWAAEHQEPVYPSIAKYLERFGISIHRDGSLQADFFKANEPMSAYTANLLGISLEESENERSWGIEPKGEP